MLIELVCVVEFYLFSCCCVFVVPSGDDIASELSELLCEQLQSVASFHVLQDIHISLSKTFVIRHHWIEPMVADLRRKLALCQS